MTLVASINKVNRKWFISVESTHCLDMVWASWSQYDIELIRNQCIVQNETRSILGDYVNVKTVMSIIKRLVPIKNILDFDQCLNV